MPIAVVYSSQKQCDFVSLSLATNIYTTPFFWKERSETSFDPSFTCGLDTRDETYQSQTLQQTRMRTICVVVDVIHGGGNGCRLVSLVSKKYIVSVLGFGRVRSCAPKRRPSYTAIDRKARCIHRKGGCCCLLLVDFPLTDRSIDRSID